MNYNNLSWSELSLIADKIKQTNEGISFLYYNGYIVCTYCTHCLSIAGFSQKLIHLPPCTYKPPTPKPSQKPQSGTMTKGG